MPSKTGTGSEQYRGHMAKPTVRARCLSPFCFAARVLGAAYFSCLLACAFASAADPQTKPTISGPRDYFRLAGIDQAMFSRLQDGQPWRNEEDETLLRILFRLRRMRLEDVDRWARPGLPWAELEKNPGPLKGEIFSLQGRVRSIQAVQTPPELARRFDISRYYRAEFLDGQTKRPVVLFALHVPSAWRPGTTIDEPAGATGVFLKTLESEGGQPRPLLAVSRIAWYPNTMLGRLGMDVGLLDDLRDRKPITAEERECFYQMLAAVGRAKPGELLRQAEQELHGAGKKTSSVVPLFNEPATQRGRLLVLSGTVRRAIEVSVHEPDIAARFHLDHYYELALFTDDSQDNPLICCVRQLPPGMPTGEGPDYFEQIRLAGFFLKTWAYHSAYAAALPQHADDKTLEWQLAPLLVGREPVWYSPPSAAHSSLYGAIAGVLFVLAILGIWAAVWRYGGGGKKGLGIKDWRSESIGSGESRR